MQGGIFAPEFIELLVYMISSLTNYITEKRSNPLLYFFKEKKITPNIGY